MGTKSRVLLPQSVRFNVLRRDGFTCRYCGRSSPEVTLEVDHMVSVANGGTDDETNLITSCFDCNRGKGSTDVVIEPRLPPVIAADGTRRSAYDGFWAHILLDGEIQHQVQILRRAAAAGWLVQYFSFWSGEPTNIGLIPESILADATLCVLYPSSEAMNRAYYAREEQRQREWLQQEREEMARIARAKGAGDA
jgi:hypothetical protein